MGIFKILKFVAMLAFFFGVLYVARTCGKVF